MKCRSVACIWSESPPVHRVTAAAVLNRPPTLYTGGSNGSIIWWDLPTANSRQDIRPIAMLCGHAAAISDLAICFPAMVPGDEKVEDPSNVPLNSNLVNYGALISASTDGVLCIWSRGSGHCRRRRKMPPWVGIPSMVRPLSENRRYVCVACSFVDSADSFGHQSLDSAERVEASVDGESQQRKPSKCTVVIVDSYTLTIVQTIFHGNLSIGPLKFMAVNMSVEDMEKQSVLLVDLFGKVQCVPILKNSDLNGENSTDLQKSSSHLQMTDWASESSNGAHVVAFATQGPILALVYKTHSIFRLVDDGTIIGEISFLNHEISFEGSATESLVIGGMFLESAGMGLYNGWSCNIAEYFVAWNNRGAAVVYAISYFGNIFKFEPLSGIPAVSHPHDVKLSICFVQLNCYLLRIESICCHTVEPLLWKPHVTIWSLPLQHDNNEKFSQECTMLAKGCFFDDWISTSSPPHTEGIGHNIGIKSRGLKYIDDECSSDRKCGFSQKAQHVSSSMVVSENIYTPYALVYGFYGGEIEVLHLNMFFEGVHVDDRSPSLEVGPHASKQYLSGHTGAVRCLAARRMLGVCKERSFSHVLVSGSMDCTIRIWDLDSGNLIRVMHQHVAPVRQIIFPPARTDRPWSNCFLSVGEDYCVALASLETLQVERMFPGHPYYPEKVIWDSIRGYVACLCPNRTGMSDSFDVLYIWDVKTGARERVLRGNAAHSMFYHFCTGISTLSSTVMNGNTSVSSLVFPVIEDANFSHSHSKALGKGATSSKIPPSAPNMTGPNVQEVHASKGSAAKHLPYTESVFGNYKHPVKSSCPFPGIATLSFDLSLLMSLSQANEFIKDGADIREKTHVKELEGEKRANTHVKEQGAGLHIPHHVKMEDSNDLIGTSADTMANYDWFQSFEGCLLRFSLSFLHAWNVDIELDKLLITDMKLKRPDNFIVASGLLGDRGSMTLTLPGSSAFLELWKSSSEFCAIRSLIIMSLAQHMISLSHSCSAASSALAAFYTRNFAEIIPDVKPPLLQILVSFWQDECEHVRMAARSLFHCAASRAIPYPLCGDKAKNHVQLLGSFNEIGKGGHKMSSQEDTSTDSSKSERLLGTPGPSQAEESEILSWLESFEMLDWISCVEGTSQDAMTSHIIVAAALAIWYPSLVNPSLAKLAVHPLTKLVMSMNEKYSSTAAEILAEGIESTWKACICSEIPHLIGDIFFQIECSSGASTNTSALNSAPPHSIRKNLVEILLPSLAMADVPGFLNVIESQVWSTASDSPVHIVSLMTLTRVVRGSPRNLAQYLEKAVTFILQTMDPGNSVMRRTCLQSSMTALKEVVRVYPMVRLNATATRLAVGDAIGEINSASIRVYEMQSLTKIKVLDASGPLGLPSLLGEASEIGITTAISALSFSLDGEGVVAFSEQGLMIRWWSLGFGWWEKLSWNLVPVQCTKLIFVPPWEGFPPNSARTSVMANVMGDDRKSNLQENSRGLSEMDRLKFLIHNLDLSYRLEWVGERKVQLSRQGHELGTFQL